MKTVKTNGSTHEKSAIQPNTTRPIVLEIPRELINTAELDVRPLSLDIYNRVELCNILKYYKMTNDLTTGRNI